MYFCSTKFIFVQQKLFLFNNQYFYTVGIELYLNNIQTMHVVFPLKKRLCERATNLRHAYTVHLGPFRRTSKWSVVCPPLMGTDVCQIK
jgi:hypothetical protein